MTGTAASVEKLSDARPSYYAYVDKKDAGRSCLYCEKGAGAEVGDMYKRKRMGTAVGVCICAALMFGTATALQQDRLRQGQ
mgnify:CR=1 FL=1